MRTVFFIHAHKCAGTSIVDLFARHEPFRLVNGWRQTNGMPRFMQELKTVKSYDVLSGKYGVDGMERFFSRMDARGVNFVATEWVVPDMEALQFTEDYYYFTVLRDPLERYLSNYHFDLRAGYRRVADIYEYPDGAMFREPDYYTRLFSSRLERDPAPTTRHDLERAVSLLRKLDAVIIQEDPASFRVLRDLGIDESLLGRRNSSPVDSQVCPDGFAEYFRERAQFDYEIYSEATRLASVRECSDSETDRGV